MVTVEPLGLRADFGGTDIRHDSANEFHAVDMFRVHLHLVGRQNAAQRGAIQCGTIGRTRQAASDLLGRAKTLAHSLPTRRSQNRGEMVDGPGAVRNNGDTGSLGHGSSSDVALSPTRSRQLARVSSGS